MLVHIFGGLGLFLLGMVLMTDGLKALAGDALRRVLASFTGGPLSAFASGAAVTTVVQSSSATTLTTIGFVSAGLLTLQQAVGVIIGANLGTTSTGWLVSMLGLKVSVSVVALPLVGVGALGRLLGRGRVTHGGLALAGFGLIFVGIDTLQEGMEGLSKHFDPGTLPSQSFGGLVVLVGIGLAMTVVLQSSSAAVATTLAALHAGTITMDQAMALVIGQNIGTTVTAAIASVGASVPAKRTAVAHIIFNLITGVVALLLLPVFAMGVERIAGPSGENAPVGLAAFHTGFNLLGVAIFLPATGWLARTVVRIVPEREPTLTRHLDRSVVNMPEVAIEMVRRTVRDVAAAAVAAVHRLTVPGDEEQLLSEREADRQIDDVEEALERCRAMLAQVRAPAHASVAYHRLLATLHAMDHLGRLVGACDERGEIGDAVNGSQLSEPRAELSAQLHAAVDWLESEHVGSSGDLSEYSRRIAALRKRGRKRILEVTAQGDLDPIVGAQQLNALHWLDRLAFHTWRAMFHLQEPPPSAHAADEEPMSEVGARRSRRSGAS